MCRLHFDGMRACIRNPARTMSDKSGSASQDPSQSNGDTDKKGADYERWGNPSSYPSAWNQRAALAADLIPDGATVFEIGVGRGAFRDMIRHRCIHVGADLAPLDPDTTPLNLETDSLPDQRFDYVTLLGVLEYLHCPETVAGKLTAITDRLVLSYCCCHDSAPNDEIIALRRRRGWVNDFDLQALVALFQKHGFELHHTIPYKEINEFSEAILLLERKPRYGTSAPNDDPASHHGPAQRGAQPTSGPASERTPSEYPLDDKTAPQAQPKNERKIIWTCWLQGRDSAPAVVRACLNSWQAKNPDWELRCLDAATIRHYIPLEDYIDLNAQTLTAASLSDFVRLLLLREYGGVWVDATLFCNRPLDDWLHSYMDSGFFAFSAPGPDRPLASWFLAARPDNLLISRWLTAAARYWQGRAASEDYFWLHHLFADLLDNDAQATAAWSNAPKVTAAGPHQLQIDIGLYRAASDALPQIDWTVPVFKLTHRVNEQLYKPGCLLDHLIQSTAPAERNASLAPASPEPAPLPLAALKVATKNLGDHIQIVAGLNMLQRFGAAPALFIDRDNEIHTAHALDATHGPAGMLLNGWFKTNGAEWPPHPNIRPIFLGFHIRLFQCPELLSAEAIAYYRSHAPIGCRDPYTADLLRQHDVDAYVSHCLTLTLPRRLELPETQTEIFVVSRDRRILDRLPASCRDAQFVLHYSDSTDFSDNVRHAVALLHRYASTARLIVTTMLHCALPAIAMGIPVVVFYPENTEAGHASDLERFSDLSQLTRVYNPDEADQVDWSPKPIDVTAIKLDLLDSLREKVYQYCLERPRPIGPIAPPSALRVPHDANTRGGKN